MTDTQSRDRAVLATGVAVLITSSRDEILLHLRDNIEGICWPGYWSLIGGHPDPGETLAQSAGRELEEETGLTVPLEELATVEQVGAAHPNAAPVAVYRGRWDGDAADLPLTEGVMLHWFPTAVLPRLRIPSWCLRAIEIHQSEQGRAA